MTIEQSPVAPVVVVTRWRRFGHDRAYVQIDGADVGYRNLATGEAICGEPNTIDLVTSATDALYQRVQANRPPEYQARHAVEDEPAPAPTPQQTLTQQVEIALLPDRDLAMNRPGQAARERARELKAEAPVHTFVSRLLGRKTDERNWRIGADGEGLVADRLSVLGDEWHALHAVPVGERDSDIDHVLIGPAGVFTINTKHHPQCKVWAGGETFIVNGTRLPYVRKSRHEARRAATLLTAAAGFDVEVTGIVAVVGAHNGPTIKDQPADGRVMVLGRKQLVDHLRKQPEVLGAPSIARIFEVARHLATWRPKTVGWQEFPASAG